MQDLSPQSPEARRKRGTARFRAEVEEQLGLRTVEIIKRVAVGVYSDGFIHAGNLAYLTLVALFPFFIVAAAVAQVFGKTTEGLAAVNAFLSTLPPNVEVVLREPIHQALVARTGNLLWFGAAVGLWTVGSLIETIRDILRRAYGTKSSRPFWHYRLGSIGIIFVCVFAIMFAFSLQVIIGAADAFLHRLLPFADEAIAIVQATRIAPALILFVGLFYLFAALTPSRYRGPAFPKWPGAAMTTGWWYVTCLALPTALSYLGGYNLTYGGLAGAMITLIFFFIIGLGVVIGAELNAALAEFPDTGEELDTMTPATEMRETSGE
ncbi:YihY/virulence factor BrkB family protein [Sphingobium sufflavum]|jgi:membrane protein|uniref:YihY/virulence factor BrkB family protein n=1 Tax=Sphingobium sufflavum TaxID=1129547 RepID=UPI001F22171E|nr:YihY/virulence factor BrkB family protein [Sphingobium sufflavum]MCE7795599.1 YihY/virulence factor BrkB family protein [Sphingobium sufflavum]